MLAWIVTRREPSYTSLAPRSWFHLGGNPTMLGSQVDFPRHEYDLYLMLFITSSGGL